jgi:hypothetical protein
MNQPNKSGQPLAEVGEGRPGIKENIAQPNTPPTHGRKPVHCVVGIAATHRSHSAAPLAIFFMKFRGPQALPYRAGNHDGSGEHDPLYLAAIAFSLLLRVPAIDTLGANPTMPSGWRWIAANLLFIQNLTFRLGWVSDRTGYRYDPVDPGTGALWPFDARGVPRHRCTRRCRGRHRQLQP